MSVCPPSQVPTEPGFYFVRLGTAEWLAFVRMVHGQRVIEMIDAGEEWGRTRVILSEQEANKMPLEWQSRLQPGPWRLQSA